jgi:hypothetical protein
LENPNSFSEPFVSKASVSIFFGFYGVIEKIHNFFEKSSEKI